MFNMVSSLKGFLNLDKFQDTILHFLDSLELSETQTTLVGDVVDTTFSFSVFSTCSTDLEVELAGSCLKLLTVSSQFGQANVHGGSDGSSQVGGAESEETETIRAGEWYSLLNFVDTVGETTEDSAQISSLLHRNNTQMILFVHPDEESLVIIVVNTTSSGPVAASIGSLKESVSLLEEEMIINELLLGFLGHAGKGVVSTLKFSSQALEGGRNLLFHLLVLSFSETGVEGISLQGAPTTNSGGQNVLSLRVYIDQHTAVTEVPSGVLVALLESTMVVFDDGVEEVSEESVGFSIRGINTNSRVQVLHTRLDDIQETGSEGGLESLELVKNFRGQVLLQQRLAVIRSLELAESSLQLLGSSSVNHSGTFAAA